MALIKFQLGLAANYAALQTKDADTLYFLTDSKEIYFGEHRLGNGTVPTLIGKNLTVAGTTLDLSTFLTAEEVASAISTAISAMGAVYIIKGSATVSLINALNPSATPATVKAGDVYNISDNGTISLPSGATLSNIDVRAGDNVVYTSSGWDKLAATENVDWSAILSKPTTIDGYGITDANINNGVITLGSQTITPVQAVSGKGLSTNDYTTAEKNKLAGIATGAEVNVQSDWNLTNTNADDYIKNKPNLSTYATVSDLTNVEYTTAAALNDLNSRIIANQYVITLDMSALLTDYPNLKVLYLRENSSSDSDDNISLSKFVAGKWLLLMGAGTFQCNILFASGTSYSYTGIVRNDMSKSKLTVTKTGESGGQPTLSFTWS